MARKPKIERFNQRVLSKYQIYNNLFLTLPFSSLKKTSILLPLFTDFCKSQYKNNNDPKSIIDSFFSNYLLLSTTSQAAENISALIVELFLNSTSP